MLPANAQLVLEQGKPGVPFHAFISGEGEEKWQDFLSDYAKTTGGEDYILEAGQYLHLDMPEMIAETSADLIDQSTSD